MVAVELFTLSLENTQQSLNYANLEFDIEARRVAKLD